MRRGWYSVKATSHAWERWRQRAPREMRKRDLEIIVKENLSGQMAVGMRPDRNGNVYVHITAELFAVCCPSLPDYWTVITIIRQSREVAI